MNLGAPKQAYEYGDQTQMRRQIEQADKQNHKKNQDIEVGRNAVILTDVVTGQRYALTMVSGVPTYSPVG